MSRIGRYDAFVRSAIADDLGIDDIDSIDPADHATPANTGHFDWFLSMLPPPIRDEDGQPRWDVFVSYASERREELVLPLVVALRELDVRVWLDQDEYSTGYVDRAINRGVAATAVGLLVLSPEYLHKEWTRYEFEALLCSEVTTFVLVGHGLDARAIEVLGRFQQRVSSVLDVTVVALKSNRTRGLARRTRAAVRRARRANRHRLSQEQFDHVVATVQALREDFADVVPDPAELRRHEERLAQEALITEMRDLSERSFGGDWDLMADKLPIEVLEESDASELPDRHWR